MAADHARQFEPRRFVPARIGWWSRSSRRYAVAKTSCQRPEQAARFEQALAEVTGQRVGWNSPLSGRRRPQPAPAASGSSPPQQRLLEVMKHPLVRRAGELFGAQPLRSTNRRSERRSI